MTCVGRTSTIIMHMVQSTRMLGQLIERHKTLCNMCNFHIVLSSWLIPRFPVTEIVTFVVSEGYLAFCTPIRSSSYDPVEDERTKQGKVSKSMAAERSR